MQGMTTKNSEQIYLFTLLCSSISWLWRPYRFGWRRLP